LLHRYPFLDRRTSHFLLVLSIVVVAIAIADAAFRLAAIRRALGVAVLVVAAGLYFSGVSEYIGQPSIPTEDVRSQVRYVEENQTTGDTILISVLGGWGFAYYWEQDAPTFVETTKFATGFGVAYSRDDIIIASGRSIDAVDESVRQAVEASMRSESSGRIWLVRTHMNGAEAAAWADALDSQGLSFTEIDTGVEPLTLIETTGAQS
jgi:hypothetical protein